MPDALSFPFASLRDEYYSFYLQSNFRWLVVFLRILPTHGPCILICFRSTNIICLCVWLCSCCVVCGDLMWWFCFGFLLTLILGAHSNSRIRSNILAIWIIDVMFKTYHHSGTYSNASAAIRIRDYVAKSHRQKCDSNQPSWPKTNETHAKWSKSIIFWNVFFLWERRIGWGEEEKQIISKLCKMQIMAWPWL